MVALKEAEQRNFVKLRKALRFKEANIITLNALILLLLSVGIKT